MSLVQLSPHFSLAEFTRSETASRQGLDNRPPPLIMENLKITAHCMEQVRTFCGDRPIQVFSAYRSRAVNLAVGGSLTSDHMTGRAVDFKPVGLSIRQTVELLRSSGLHFDQLIDEFNSWVHIGFGTRMRRQILSARSIRGRTTYTNI